MQLVEAFGPDIAPARIGQSGARPDRELHFTVDGHSIDVLLSEQETAGGAGGTALTLRNSALLQAILKEEARLGRDGFASAMTAVGRDAAVENLARALVAAAATTPGDNASLNSIGTALIVRAIAISRVRGDGRAQAALKAPLPKWRLNRVVEYVDTRLDERVTLAEMAGVAGLTRMHFAAQFRRATGVSPHAYLLQRRVERAKELLRDTTRPLVDIALSVGFGTQPHFTTVFKRFVGETPRRWRQSIAR